jgi:aspartyl-tRNA(Asn)/glutamyl-tRNA(Gln) amidotransferase subunit A
MSPTQNRKRVPLNGGLSPQPAVEEIAGAVRSGGMTATSAVRDALERVAAHEDEVRAWVHIDPEAEGRAGGSLRTEGRLAGVPFGVKDLIDVAGAPTRLGLAPDEYQPAPTSRSAAAIERLEAEGALAIGKTVTSALALDRAGPTRHPLDPSRSPGASSSGSAAAVAAGMVPLALGSQAVGSVIRPASYCGVWAFVPSLGAVPADGSLVLAPSLDRIGLFASSARGLSLAAAALLGAGPEAAPADQHERDYRIALLADRELAARAPEPCHRLDALLRDHAGLLRPLPAQIGFAEVLRATRTIAAFELHRGLRQPQSPLASLDGGLLASLLPQAPREKAYRAALAFRDGLAAAWSRLTAGFDAVLLPSAAAEALFGSLDAQDPAPAALGSLLGLPAVNIPLFASRGGLPLGCQLLGRRDGDVAALRAAEWLATALSAEGER